MGLLGFLELSEKHKEAVLTSSSQLDTSESHPEQTASVETRRHKTQL